MPARRYRRRAVRRKRGRGRIMEKLKSLNSFLKKHNIVSKGLDLAGYSTYASAARTLGYGKRKRRVRRRRGRGIWSDIKSGVRRAIKNPKQALKSSGLVSTGVGAALGLATGSPAVGAVAKYGVNKLTGWGRRRRVGRPRKYRGRGVKSFVKDTGLISSGVGGLVHYATGSSLAGGIAKGAVKGLTGYGRRRCCGRGKYKLAVMPKRQMGSGIGYYSPSVNVSGVKF